MVTLTNGDNDMHFVEAGAPHGKSGNSCSILATFYAGEHEQAVREKSDGRRDLTNPDAISSESEEPLHWSDLK